jgi:HEAT repeat protein
MSLPDSNNIEELADALREIENDNENITPEQLAEVALLKDHQNEVIRRAVAAALLGIEDTIAVNALIQLSRDEDVEVRSWATYGLGSYEINNVTEVLWERINDEDEETRFEAIVGLARRKDIRTKDIIKRELADAEFGSLLFEAIEELGDPEFLPILEHILANNVDHKTNEHWIKHLKTCMEELKEGR